MVFILIYFLSFLILYICTFSFLLVEWILKFYLILIILNLKLRVITWFIYYKTPEYLEQFLYANLLLNCVFYEA